MDYGVLNCSRVNPRDLLTISKTSGTVLNKGNLLLMSDRLWAHYWRWCCSQSLKHGFCCLWPLCSRRDVDVFVGRAFGARSFRCLAELYQFVDSDGHVEVRTWLGKEWKDIITSQIDVSISLESQLLKDKDMCSIDRYTRFHLFVFLWKNFWKAK